MADKEYTSMKVGYLCSEIEKQHIIPGRDCQNFVISQAKKQGIELQPKSYMKTQRKYCYDSSRASNLIQYTMIKEADVPEVYAYRNGSDELELKFIDGQQRTTTFYFFTHDKFPLNLSKSIYPKFVVEGKEYTADDLNGKYFSELDKDWQDRILNVDIRMTIHNNCSEQKAKELFYIYSEGTKSLTEVDKRRNLIDEKTLDVLDDIINDRWIYHLMTMNAASDNAGLNLMLQIMTMFHYNGNVSLDKKTINDLIANYKYNSNGILPEIEGKLRNASKYLIKAFDLSIKEKKKSDTPEQKKKIKNYNLFVYPVFKNKKPYHSALFWAASQAVENKISEKVFSTWMIEFFKEPSQLFMDGMGTRQNKSGDIENVQKRLQAIDDEILKLVDQNEKKQ